MKLLARTLIFIFAVIPMLYAAKTPIQKIQDKGVLRVAIYKEAAAPFLIRNKKKEVKGIDIENRKASCRRLRRSIGVD